MFRPEFGRLLEAMFTTPANKLAAQTLGPKGWSASTESVDLLKSSGRDGTMFCEVLGKLPERMGVFESDGECPSP